MSESQENHGRVTAPRQQRRWSRTARMLMRQGSGMRLRSVGASLLVAGFLLEGCDLTPTAAIPDIGGGAQTVSTSQLGRRSEFPSVPRTEVEISARGPFQPGRPISLSAALRGRVNASAVNLRILSLDDGTVVGALGRSEARQLRSWDGPLASGAEHSVGTSIVFPDPGYYRVIVTLLAEAAPTSARWLGDSLVRDANSATVWIRVAENDGRLTDGFDSTAIHRDEVAEYGAYGRFRPKAVRSQRPARFSSRTPERRAPGLGFAIPWALSASSYVGLQGDGGPSAEPMFDEGDGSGVREPGVTVSAAGNSRSLVSGEIEVNGYIKYANRDNSPSTWDPVDYADISAQCVGRSSIYTEDYDLVENVSTYTITGGYFNIYCAPPEGGVFDYVQGTVYLRNSQASVTGPNGAMAGAYIYSFGSGSLGELHVANDDAARVFLDLRTYAPLMQSKFGRTRGQVSAQVHQNDDDFGIWYCGPDPV